MTEHEIATEVNVTREERDALHFIPQVQGGKIISEALQLRLQAKGLITSIRPDGRRWLTPLGDQVRRNYTIE
ncbi:MAG: hypothetical protein JO369_09170 [Paucibacter sp.]|nr:hypothetical protein [Roseateles sp.]MBV8380915.1 hypothetical protein [Roseateles sp.]